MRVTPVNRRFYRYEPGQEFDLPDKTARILIKVGKLREVTTAALAAEPVSEELSPRTGLPKRVYRRRDMTAEG